MSHPVLYSYFYCSRTAAEPERACAVDTLRCLVKEISTGNIGHEKCQIPGYIDRKYEAAGKSDSASGKPTAAECRTLGARFANDHQKLYIFVDALDELEEPVQHVLIERSRLVAKGAPKSHVKLLVSSRDDMNVASLFPQLKT